MGDDGSVSERGLIRTTGALFVVGSALFALGVVLQLVPHWPALVGGVSYAVGAVFFTSAASCQFALAMRDLPEHPVRWFRIRGMTADVAAAVIQLVGTVLFNVNTISYCFTIGRDALVQDVSWWLPDAFGSIAFLVSSGIALAPEVRARRQRHIPDRDWMVAGGNMAGSVLFGISAVFAFVRPEAGPLSDAWTNIGTGGGALCFLVAAWIFGFPIGGLHLAPVPGTDPRTSRRPVAS